MIENIPILLRVVIFGSEKVIVPAGELSERVEQLTVVCFGTGNVAVESAGKYII